MRGIFNGWSAWSRARQVAVVLGLGSSALMVSTIWLWPHQWSHRSWAGILTVATYLACVVASLILSTKPVNGHG